MQTFPEFDQKFQQRHRVVFGVCEDAQGNIVRAIHFPDLEIFVAGNALKAMTLLDAMQLAERCRAPKQIETGVRAVR